MLEPKYFTDVMTIEIRIAEPCSKEEKRRALVTKLIELTDAVERKQLPLTGGAINNDAGYLSYTVLPVQAPSMVCEEHGQTFDQGVCPECAHENADFCEPISA